MARLGDTLRQHRERMGITLEQAAEDTRIREKFLRALEDGDYQSLPGTVYTKGFLRNYAEYLNVGAEEMIALYTGERGNPEAPRTFSPMRPLVKRSFIFTPAVFLPVAVLAGIVLFVGYLYYLVRGRTVPDGHVRIRVSPGLDPIGEIRPNADGTFSASVPLKPGPNHIEVQVLDAAGKVGEATRTIQFSPTVATEPQQQQAPQLILEQPPNGGTYTNAPVTVSGRVDRSVASVLVNGTPVTVGADFRFAVTVNFAAGQQTVRVVAKTATGGEVQETRTVAVSYNAAIVTVRVTGGEAWLLATIDGTQAPNTNKVFPAGQVLTFTGRQVIVRTGNAGATFLVYNGQDLGKMGETGQVVERSFAFQ